MVQVEDNNVSVESSDSLQNSFNNDLDSGKPSTSLNNNENEKSISQKFMQNAPQQGTEKCEIGKILKVNFCR